MSKGRAMSREQIETDLTTSLLEGNTLTFVARDLGFADHTAIHEAAKPILAKYIAHIIWGYREASGWTPRKIKE